MRNTVNRTGYHARSNVVPLFPKKQKHKGPEPERIGPLEDIPECGCCKYTSDDVLKPGWRMCGQPVNIKENGDKYAWCDWHKENVIYNPLAKVSV